MAATQANASLSGYVPLRPSWDLNTKLQQSSKTWLREHGLERQHLTLEQILASTGFKQKKGFVKPLGREVSSRYAADAFFQQKSPSTGELFNVINKQELERKEKQLLTAVAKFRARLEWLTSGSRQTCGPVMEASTVLLFHATSCPTGHLPVLLAVAKGLVEQQFANITSFNIVRCQSDINIFSDSAMVDSTSVFIQSAVKFLATGAQSSPSKLGPALPVSLQKALQLTGAQAVYALAYSEALTAHLEELKNTLRSSPIPVHFICFVGSSSQKNIVVNCLKELSAAAHGRYRVISVDKSSVGHGICVENDTLPEDNLVLEEELESAKDTLAEVQALLLEMNSKQTSLVTAKYGHSGRKLAENTLTSAEWLKIHGLNSKKLLFSDLLSSLAFRHCEAVLDLPTPPPDDTPSQVPSKLVGARYCRSFIHLRWPDGKVFHVSLSDVTASRYQQQVADVVRSCEKRLEWLQRGSRKTFSVVTANKVAIVIDTSVSMKGSFQTVKDDLSLLLEEQLNTVHHYFTLVQCSSHTFSWREGLVPCTPQNLAAALKWLQSLQSIGSTNIIAALRAAIFIPSVEAVYLLTDGNSDQSVTQILSQLSQWPHVPLHTVSFNHDDSRANKLLSQLAVATGGQYHSHHNLSISSEPSPYKSGDVELIENELAAAKEQIEKAQMFQAECKQLKQQPPIDLTDHDEPRPSGNKKKKERIKTRSAVDKTRRDSANVKNTSMAGSTDNVSVLSSQASAISLASSPAHMDTKCPMSRPSSASSERSHDSNYSSNKLSSKKSQLSSQRRKKVTKKHYKVLAQSDCDGFYYPAIVTGDDGSHYKHIKFADGSLQSVSNRHVISTGGATARPFLQVADHVLGRVRSMSGAHISESGACDFYIPATICVLPQQPSGSYSLLAYNKRQVRCLRRDIVKITNDRYKQTAKMIEIKLRTKGNLLPTGQTRLHIDVMKSIISSSTTVESRVLNTAQDSALIQQLLLEQQKQQTLLLNQQELLVGLHEGHKELMERVERKEANSNHSRKREWWIKKLMQHSSDVPHRPSYALKSQSTPDLGNSHQARLVNHEEEMVINTGATTSQPLIKGKTTNKYQSLQETPEKVIDLEPPGLLPEAPVTVDACADRSPTHSPTYQSCGTNTHNLVDTAVNTAPLTVDICIGTEFPSSGSDEESVKSDKSVDSPQPRPQTEEPSSPSTTTDKEHHNEDVIDAPTQPQATSASHERFGTPPTISDVQNQEVLAHSVDGYYYWGIVLQCDYQQDLYIIEDLESRQQLMMSRSDFITESQDTARQLLQLYDRVLAPHILSPNCYLPGFVTRVTGEGQYTAKLCDNTSSVCLRNEIYYLPRELYDLNIKGIRVAEQRWLEQAVLARDDRSGFYYPGTVVEVNENQFRIEQADGSRYYQVPMHVFGEYTRKISLCIGDSILALYDVRPHVDIPDDAVAMAQPGKIIGVVDKLLAVEFCNGERFCNVNPLHCFWIHPNYYEHAQQFILERSHDANL